MSGYDNQELPIAIAVNESRRKVIGPLEALELRVRALEADSKIIKTLVTQNNESLQAILDAIEAEKAKI